jgi:co-chaperonin GroES (HSP10)
MLTVKPFENKIQLNIEQPKAGQLDLSAKESAVEIAEVIAFGTNVNNVNIGDRLMVKAWAIDIITFGGEKYYFIDSDSRGLCAIIK